MNQRSADTRDANFRVAIGIEYDGTAYSGWQQQPHAPSIQQSLNAAISAVADNKVQCIGAGRTDAGVHATGQVAHFDTPAARSERSWLLGINSNLPDDIAVVWAQSVTSEFHARFSALTRSYKYRILNRPVRSSIRRHQVWWLHQQLDLAAMIGAAECLVGEHDFSAFRAAACQAHSPVRNMHEFRIAETAEDEIHIHCVANAFLHHMVRNIVGSLAKVGLGEASPDWLAEVLASRDRKQSGITAPACGLSLTHVGYPAELLAV